MRIPVVLIVIAAATLVACSRPGEQKDFASPEAAAEALVKAAGSDDTSALVAVLGKEAEPLVDSGDPVQDKNGREKFVQGYQAAHSFAQSIFKAARLFHFTKRKGPQFLFDPAPVIGNEGIRDAKYGGDL